MKREYLKEIGLTDEQVEKVMAENGQDIERFKTLSETKEAEVATLKEQLSAANTQIEEFKDLNVDEIKAKADEYKEKYEQAEIKAKEEKEQLQFEHQLENALGQSRARNSKAVRALLDLEKVKLEDGKITGLEEQLKVIREENDYLFSVEDTSKPQIVGGVGRTEEKKEPTKSALDILKGANIRK